MCCFFFFFLTISASFRLETGKQGNRETGKQGNRKTGKQGNRETGKQGNRETGKQGNRETGKQGNRETKNYGLSNFFSAGVYIRDLGQKNSSTRAFKNFEPPSAKQQKFLLSP